MSRNESDRPHSMVVYRDEDGEIKQKKVMFTDEEWDEYEHRENEHKAKLAEMAKNEHLYKREEAYQDEIYPYMQKAIAMQQLEGDDTLINELKQKKIDIMNKYPEPTIL